MVPELSLNAIEEGMDTMGLDGMQRIATPGAYNCLVGQYIRTASLDVVGTFNIEDVIVAPWTVKVKDKHTPTPLEIQHLIRNFDDHCGRTGVHQVTAKTCRRLLSETRNELASVA